MPNLSSSLPYIWFDHISFIMKSRKLSEELQGNATPSQAHHLSS